MEERRPLPGQRYRHFKNKLYQVVGIAKHSETMEEMVVYQALYGDYGLYVRPLSMFVSEVDHKKYPEVTQKYRFELVSQTSETKEDTIATDWKESEPNNDLMSFLEAETNKDKLRVLQDMKEHITADMLETMALALEVEVDVRNTEMGYYQLEKVLMTLCKFEGRR